MTNKNNLVSVIIIFLNSEQFLLEAIESVLNQSWSYWELFLVDDGSKDRSTGIAKSICNEYSNKIFYLEHNNHENLGMSASRNLGIYHSKGPLVAFLDSDDVWLPQKLEEQVNIFNSYPEVDMVYGRIQYWYNWPGNENDGQNDFIDNNISVFDKTVKPPELFFRNYPIGSELSPTPSEIMIKKTLLTKVGGFEEHFIKDFQLFEDIALLVKVYLKGIIYPSNSTWIKYRIHKHSCGSQSRKDGTFFSVRDYYMKWLSQYISKENINDKLILGTINKRKLIWHIQFLISVPYYKLKINRLRHQVNRIFK